MFGKKKSVVSIADKDKRFIPQIEKYISNCEIKTDDTIKIGGIKCYCEEMSIIADDTLDSKFEIQKRKFVDNSGFTVE